MALKLYEGMFLFDSNLATKDWPLLERSVQDLLSKNGAELVYSERWPDRKLCYEIQGCKKGTYFLTYFRAPPEAIQTLKRDAELSERFLRLLILYDKELEADCQKRINREIQGSPEEIEERRERLLRETAGPLPEVEAAKVAVEVVEEGVDLEAESEAGGADAVEASGEGGPEEETN